MTVALALFALPGCQRQVEEQEVKEKPAVPVMVYVTKPDTISQYLKLTGGTEAENGAFVYSKSVVFHPVLSLG
jgi:multidrug efflux pump subunit AcrA (membrane-fusion protein)